MLKFHPHTEFPYVLSDVLWLQEQTKLLITLKYSVHFFFNLSMCLNRLCIQPEESNCIVLVNSLYLFSKKPRIQIYLLMVSFLFLIPWNQGQLPLAHSNIRLYWKSSWCKFRHISMILRLECWEDSMGSFEYQAVVRFALSQETYYCWNWGCCSRNPSLSIFSALRTSWRTKKGI